MFIRGGNRLDDIDKNSRRDCFHFILRIGAIMKSIVQKVTFLKICYKLFKIMPGTNNVRSIQNKGC